MQLPNRQGPEAKTKKMRMYPIISRILLATTLTLTGATFAQAQDADMSFFITSTNPGNGADLGGWKPQMLIAAPLPRPLA